MSHDVLMATMISVSHCSSHNNEESAKVKLHICFYDAGNTFNISSNWEEAR